MSTPSGLPEETAENTESASCCLIPEEGSGTCLKVVVIKCMIFCC
jgi:hypothetical protein